jgi:hypothetical protein
MGFTTEAIEQSPTQKGYTGPNEFDLPVKEFVGYDLSTSKSLQKPVEENKDPKQGVISEETRETAPPPKEESISLSSKMSALARADASRLKRERDLSAREKALEAKLADADKFTQLKEKLTAKDYSAAEELGMSYDEYTQYLVEKQSKDKPEEQRYNKLEERIAARERAEEEKEVREYEANQKLWTQSIVTEFGDGEKYPNLAYLKTKGMKLEDAVLDHINTCFEEDGEEWTEAEALQKFEEEAIRRAEMLSDSPVLKKKFEAQAPKLGPPRTTPKTITQNMTVTSKVPSTRPFHLMSESEQIEEARRRVQAARMQR